MSSSLTVGLVQQQWYSDPQEHEKHLESSIEQAAKQGAQLVCLQELSLSPYFCSRADVSPEAYSEEIGSGPSSIFASRVAKKYQVYLIISLVEKGEKGNCYNTAVTFAPDGTLLGKTRKLHIPSGEGYHETLSFTPGAPEYPLHNILGHAVATPTCYDQWFPELARIYALKGAELLVYPTAIGGEPTAPGFDSQPMWQAVQIGHAVANNCFVIAVNRIGSESMGKDSQGQEKFLTLYGSSFIAAPNGKILAQAPRDKAAVLVATLDFTLREECRRLFPFYQQRRPEDYPLLTAGKNPDLLPDLYGYKG